MGKKKMNKIVIDKELCIDNYNGEIFYTLSDNIINIKGNCTIYDFNTNKNVNINLLDDSSLLYYKIRNNNKDTKLLINQMNNTYLDYKEIIINNDDFNYEINVDIKGNNNVSKVGLRCLNESGNAFINANGRVEEKTFNNELLEDLRGLNINNKQLIIKPDMQINSLDVVANHKVTISNVSKEELFYLQRKKKKKDSAISLLKEGFILGILPLEMKEEIKDYLN